MQYSSQHKRIKIILSKNVCVWVSAKKTTTHFSVFLKTLNSEIWGFHLSLTVCLLLYRSSSENTGLFHTVLHKCSLYKSYLLLLLLLSLKSTLLITQHTQQSKSVKKKEESQSFKGQTNQKEVYKYGQNMDFFFKQALDRQNQCVKFPTQWEWNESLQTHQPKLYVGKTLTLNRCWTSRQNQCVKFPTHWEWLTAYKMWTAQSWIWQRVGQRHLEAAWRQSRNLVSPHTTWTLSSSSVRFLLLSEECFPPESKIIMVGSVA